MSKGRSPYDYVKNISEKIDVTAFEDREYSPWMVNRIMSLAGPREADIATILTTKDIPKRLNFLFYWFKIPKKKRFIKYFKKVQDKALEAVMYIYGVNEAVAESYINILTTEQLQIIVSQSKFYKENK